jgi:hypothetical protein
MARCPNCGNTTRHETLHRADWYEVNEDDMVDECWWAILKCSTCGKFSLYRDYWDGEQGRWIGKLIFPTPVSSPLDVPEQIRQLFSEAIAVRQQSPSLCTVGLRKCLEAVAIDQGCKGSLAQAIEALSTQGVIPATLSKMMDSSRLIANLGAHATGAKLTSDDVDLLVNFVLAIFEYVYVAPKKIAAVQQRLDTLKP